MEGHDASLAMAADRQDALFSPELLVTCSTCKLQSELQFHCNNCGNFYLCVPCNNKKVHQREVHKIDLNLDVKPASGNRKIRWSQKQRYMFIQRTINDMIHACMCKGKCGRSSCQKMTYVIMHTKTCVRKPGAKNCRVCKQLVALCCFHARNCTVTNCKVPLCGAVKHKIEQQLKESMSLMLHRVQMRQMAVMNVSDEPVAMPQAEGPAPAPPPPGPTFALPPPADPAAYAQEVQESPQQMRAKLL